MATTYYNDLQKLYVAYFNRPADPKGLAYWEGVVEAAHGDTSAVSASFAASAEYQATYSGMTNAQVVNAVYNNLFGHNADSAGQTYWANLLDAKTLTIDAVVTAIAGGAQGTDMTAYNDKVTAASAFTAALTTDAEVAGYQGAANAAAKAWLSGVTDSTSLTTALDPANLATTVATTVAAGTPFTVAGALASIDAAQTALDNFALNADADNNPATAAAAIADIQAAYNDPTTGAIAKVAGDLAGGTAGASGTLFVASTTTDAVRDALISAQEATNAAQLSADQAKVTADNAAIAKVAGLAAASTTLTAATSANTAAVSAKTAADADLAGKLAAFQVNNGTTTNTGTEIDLTTSTGTVKLADVTTTKVTLADGIDATKYAGLTDLIASYNTDIAAATNVTKAGLTLANAELAVNLLDVAPDTITTGTGSSAVTSPNYVTYTDATHTNAVYTDSTHTSGYTESQLIQAIADVINGSNTTKVVADGTAPTVAQIQTELAVLKAGTDTAAYTNFQNLVNVETNADKAFNPLSAQLAADTTLVKNDTTAISTLAKDVAALHTAEANVNTLAGLEATVTADTKILSDKGYNVVTLNTDGATEFATAASDVYVVNGHSETIAAFGLQGTDSLFVGTGYTLVQGAIGAKGVVGNNSAMEIFVSSDSSGDAVLQIETHAYSSNVASTAGEIVTITLTGVDASTLHLDNSGIITSTPATA